MSVPLHPKSIKIYFSYATSSPQDKRLFNELMMHLSALIRQCLIGECYDSEISAGSSNITQIIEAHLNIADIIVLLISADFFASKCCCELEMKHALQLSNTGDARLIPVLLRPTAWQESPLDQYSPLPPNGRAVSLWSNLDTALSEVATEIRKVVEEISWLIGNRLHSENPNFPMGNVPYNKYNAFLANRETILATISSSFAFAQIQLEQLKELERRKLVYKEVVIKHQDRVVTQMLQLVSDTTIFESEEKDFTSSADVFTTSALLPSQDSIFISYSHKDKKWLEKFQRFLVPIINKEKFHLWSDAQILPGSVWKEEIQKALACAKVAVLLVSADFLASDFIMSYEFLPLLRAAEQRGLPSCG